MQVSNKTETLMRRMMSDIVREMEQNGPTGVANTLRHGLINLVNEENLILLKTHYGEQYARINGGEQPEPKKKTSREMIQEAIENANVMIKEGVDEIKITETTISLLSDAEETRKAKNVLKVIYEVISEAETNQSIKTLERVRNLAREETARDVVAEMFVGIYRQLCTKPIEDILIYINAMAERANKLAKEEQDKKMGGNK